MQRAAPTRAPKSDRWWLPNSLRDRLAVMLALVTVVCLGLGLFLSEGTQFLMPGPLASVHGAIENCSSCHAESGKGKLTWMHRLVAGSPLADSKACLTCHKMPKTAFNAHGASDAVLKKSTEQLSKFAADTPAPEWARLQDLAFPTKDVVARGLYCATCHQEHQGGNFSLNKIPNDHCQSCHVLKFDSFDGHHPEFQHYPFKRRTRIAYDHVGHFEKHFPEVAKKDPTKRIPSTCSACHNSNADKRVMATAPFEQTCSGCHLDQIIGKERVSGPKGVAFLTLPGLDLKTLKEKNALIGEWPEASDAELSPFMKMMIGHDEQGRALIKVVNGLNLQDLSNASDEQIGAVTTLVWDIKRLFYALISRKASEVLAELNVGSGGKLNADLVADLTSSIPRDVIIGAQQQWLPNLALELGNRQSAGDHNQTGWNTAITVAEATTPERKSGADAPEDTATPSPEAAVGDPPRKAKLDPPVCTMSILGQCLLFKGGDVAKAKPEQPEGDAEELDAADEADGEAPSADEQPDATQSEEATENASNQTTGGNETLEEQLGAGQTESATGEADSLNEASSANETASADLRPPERTADQTDDLLSPTADERREIEASIKKAAEGGDRDASSGDAASDSDTAKTIESDVDSETWAEHGGWYRQDYAIFYRPTGHKDKFIYSWLVLTGPRAPKGDTGAAAAAFDALTNKDAQGSCTKCHSVDDLRSKGRVVNFSPLSVQNKRGRFTNFIHEPHFQAVGIGQRIGIVENRGCLTCHVLEKGAPYLKSYEQGDPRNFASNFGAIKKELCQTCHNSGTARQDCLLCHKYHVNGVNTPIMNTRIPTQ